MYRKRKPASNYGVKCDYCNAYYPNKRAVIIHEYIHIDQDVNNLLLFLQQSEESNCLPAAHKSLPNGLRSIRISEMNWKKENQDSETYKGVSKAKQISEAIDEMVFLTKKYPLKRRAAKIPENRHATCSLQKLEYEDCPFERCSVLTTTDKKPTVSQNSDTYITCSNQSLIKTADSSVSEIYTEKYRENSSSVGYAFERKNNGGQLAGYTNCQKLETMLPKFNRRSFDSAYDSSSEEVNDSEASADKSEPTDSSNCGKSRTPITVNSGCFKMVDSTFQKQFIPDFSKQTFSHYEKNSESSYSNCTSQERNFNLHSRKLVGKVCPMQKYVS